MILRFFNPEQTGTEWNNPKTRLPELYEEIKTSR
jgi:hypothetical protein